MGSVYWPGLRTGDTYSMETLHGSGTDLTLTTNNPSGADRLSYGWGLTGGGGTGGTATLLRGAASNRCLDVPGQSRPTARSSRSGTATAEPTSSGPHLGQAAAGVRQQVLDATAGPHHGAVVHIYTCNGGTNQQWNLNADGTITGVASGKCLDVTGAGTADGALVEHLELQRRRQPAVGHLLTPLPTRKEHPHETTLLDQEKAPESARETHDRGSRGHARLLRGGPAAQAASVSEYPGTVWTDTSGDVDPGPRRGHHQGRRHLLLARRGQDRRARRSRTSSATPPPT